MRVRLTKIDEFQFLTAFKHQVWGSKTARFKEWKFGDYLAVIINKALAAVAEVSGEPYKSQNRVWDNGLFPHRIPIKFTHYIHPEKRPQIIGDVRDALTTAWGPSYGWGILNQQLLPENSAKTIINTIFAQKNDIAYVVSNIDRCLIDAKSQRDYIIPTERKRRGRPRKEEMPKLIEFDETTTKNEESLHSKTQNSLIRLGKIAGCSVWVATNDKNRSYQGKILGDGCLKSLPNLGLSEEATHRISLIDIMWLKQNTPICVFEVEVTANIHSALLRMSDLLSVVPVLQLKLFIVAPQQRKNRVMTELTRPTFKKIGLNDYCRFISIENLNSLLLKVEDLRGHIQHSILDTIALEAEDEIKSDLE